MERTATTSKKRIRHSMLRRTDELFQVKNKANLPWLAKLTAELDMDVVEITRTDLKMEF